MSAKMSDCWLRSVAVALSVTPISAPIDGWMIQSGPVLRASGFGS